MNKAPPIFTVIGYLKEYKRGELIALKNRINSMLTDSREERQSLENEDWLLHGVLAELRARGELINDRFKLKSSQSFHNFESRSVDIRTMIIEALPDDLTAVQFKAVGEFCGRELIRYLARIGRPIKLDEVLNNIHLLHRAFEKSFPGYIECGMFSLVVMRMLEGDKASAR